MNAGLAYRRKVTTVSHDCVTLVRHFSELRLNAYLCAANIPTIGYGTTVYPDGSKVRLHDNCTPEQAEDYLLHELGWFGSQVESFTKEDITQQQFDALTSFCYHAGPYNLRTSVLLQVINNNPSDMAGIGKQWMKWSKSNGKTLKGLHDRRAAELYLYRFGRLQFELI